MEIVFAALMTAPVVVLGAGLITGGAWAMDDDFFWDGFIIGMAWAALFCGAIVVAGGAFWLIYTVWQWALG